MVPSRVSRFLLFGGVVRPVFDVFAVVVRQRFATVLVGQLRRADNVVSVGCAGLRGRRRASRQYAPR